jgi:2-hydroxy-6-oxonona-2,4-dienedioate hydrolase
MPPLFARYRTEIRLARTRLQAGSQMFSTSVGMIEAALTGSGCAVLVSHGSGGGYDMGLWLAQLIGPGFQFIAPSRFGYLRSPVPPDSTPAAQADAYAALLDTLHVDSAAVIGLSAGGASALQFALRHQARCLGLVMISAVSRPVPPLPRFLRAIYPLMLRSDFIPWLLFTLSPRTVYQANGVSPIVLARIQSDRQKMDALRDLFYTTFPSTPRSAGMLNDLRCLTDFPLYPLREIAIPTLIVHAVDDPIIPIESGEFSASSIPQARFIRLPDGGHFALVTHREQVIPVVHEFISSLLLNQAFAESPR